VTDLSWLKQFVYVNILADGIVEALLIAIPNGALHDGIGFCW